MLTNFLKICSRVSEQAAEQTPSNASNAASYFLLPNLQINENKIGQMSLLVTPPKYRILLSSGLQFICTYHKCLHIKLQVHIQPFNNYKVRECRAFVCIVHRLLLQSWTAVSVGQCINRRPSWQIK